MIDWKELKYKVHWWMVCHAGPLAVIGILIIILIVINT